MPRVYFVPIAEIKNEMRMRGMSARQLAFETGLAKNTVLDLLNDKRATQRSTVRLIQLHLGLKVDPVNSVDGGCL